MPEEDTHPTIIVFGQEIRELPEGWTPVEVVMVIKCLSETGETGVAHRISEGLNSWEALGLFSAGADWLREAIREAPNDEDNEGEE